MLNARSAGLIIIALSVLVIFYHFLVLTSVIPYTAAWGGRLESYSQMVVFEIVSIAVIAILLMTVLMWQRYLPWSLPEMMLRVILWAFIILFALNTVGNLFAVSIYEKLIATPLTLLAAFLLFRLARAR